MGRAGRPAGPAANFSRINYRAASRQSIYVHLYICRSEGFPWTAYFVLGALGRGLLKIIFSFPTRPGPARPGPTGHFCPPLPPHLFWPISCGVFGRFWSVFVLFGHFGPFWSFLVIFCYIFGICLWFLYCFILSGPFWSVSVPFLLHFGYMFVACLSFVLLSGPFLVRFWPCVVVVGPF